MHNTVNMKFAVSGTGRKMMGFLFLVIEAAFFVFDEHFLAFSSQMTIISPLTR